MTGTSWQPYISAASLSIGAKLLSRLQMMPSCLAACYACCELSHGHCSTFPAVLLARQTPICRGLSSLMTPAPPCYFQALPASTSSLECIWHYMQGTPAIATAALDLLKLYPSTACTKPVEQPLKPDRLPYSPRASHLASPHQDRSRSSFKGTPPSRQASGLLGDHKPPEKSRGEKKSSWTSGRIVDWTPPGGRKGGSGAPMEKDVEQAKKAVASMDSLTPAGTKCKAASFWPVLPPVLALITSTCHCQ